LSDPDPEKTGYPVQDPDIRRFPTIRQPYKEVEKSGKSEKAQFLSAKRSYLWVEKYFYAEFFHSAL